MSQKIRLWVSIVLMVMGVSFSVHAADSPYSVLASLTSSGDMAGGVRYALNDDWVVDGWVSSGMNDSNTQTNRLWADVYRGNWGVVLNVEENADPTGAFAYSVEKELSTDIHLGIGVKLIEFSQNEPDYLGGWDMYIVLNI